MTIKKEIELGSSKEYIEVISSLKTKIKEVQLKAAISVNKELMHLYWHIGTTIIGKQQESDWGSGFIEKIAKDLRSTFPEMRGFSLTNVKYMVKFAKEYPDFLISQQVVDQIPWGHNMLILYRLDNIDSRIWYVKKTIENGWSRNVLLHCIDSDLYERQGRAITNFKNTLPSPHSDLAHETLKNPYCLDFLTLRDRFDEKELEDGLLNHIQKFLLELGAGFSFVGRQVCLNIDGKDFFIDMLFYHLKLRCFMVIELKATEFKPEFIGKLSFYLTAVDELLKHQDDKPTIGLILCKTKSKIIAEYAVRDNKKPIGIAEYETRIIESLPEDLKGSLPTVEEIEEELRQSNNLGKE